MRWRRVIGIAAIVAAVAAGLIWAMRPQPVPVDLAVIGLGTLEIEVADEGIARIDEVYTVSAPLAGRVRRVLLDPGDSVVRHETVVATIEPTPPGFLDTRSRREIAAEVDAARSALLLARAEVKRAEAEVVFWRAELTRNQQLRERGTIPLRAFEQARMQLQIHEAALETAEASVLVRESELRRAEAHLIEPKEEGLSAISPCCLNIRAPQTGRVLDVAVESETVVRAGDPILSIGNPQDLEVMVELLSSDAVQVEIGDPAVVERWGGTPLEARVLRIEPAGFEEVSALGIDEQRVRLRLELSGPPSTRRGLGHQYRVFVRILVERLQEVPLVPLGALIREGGDWAVFVADDGRTTLRKVRLGPMNDRHGLIESGLEIGEAVVLHPSDRIEDGTRVVDRARL